MVRVSKILDELESLRYEIKGYRDKQEKTSKEYTFWEGNLNGIEHCIDCIKRLTNE